MDRKPACLLRASEIDARGKWYSQRLNPKSRLAGTPLASLAGSPEPASTSLRCHREPSLSPTTRTPSRKSGSTSFRVVERFAQMFAERVSAVLPKAGRNGVAKKAGKRDMSCRYPGCENRSKGPRFRFLCEEHLKLPKKKQAEVLAKWAEKNP